MRDGHHSGSYGFTIFTQFKVGQADDYDNGNWLSVAVVELQAGFERTHPSTEPPRPAKLGDLPARHGITFFKG